MGEARIIEGGNVIEAEFVHKGMLCLVVATKLGHRCGYVMVGPTHPFYKVEYDKCSLNRCTDSFGCEHSPSSAINVHGGLTYSDMDYPKDGWWFGFDCGHGYDAPDMSIMREDYKRLYLKHREPMIRQMKSPPTVRTREYVIHEVKGLAESLASTSRNAPGKE